MCEYLPQFPGVKEQQWFEVSPPSYGQSTNTPPDVNKGVIRP